VTADLMDLHPKYDENHCQFKKNIHTVSCVCGFHVYLVTTKICSHMVVKNLILCRGFRDEQLVQSAFPKFPNALSITKCFVNEKLPPGKTKLSPY